MKQSSIGVIVCSTVFDRSSKAPWIMLTSFLCKSLYGSVI